MKKTLTALLLLMAIALYSQSFSEEQVSIGELKGTMTIPSTATSTAILIISGSGPTDRDGNSALGLNNNSLKMVAEAFTAAGYASLRFDKRGIAESRAAVTDQTSVRFNDFVEDARNWINLLAEKGYENIIIAGHSQGSLVGMLAAQDNEKVVAFISIAGLSDDAGNAIVRQLEAQSPVLAEDARINMDSIKAGYTVTKYNPYLISIFGPIIQPFLKSYIAYTPTEEIKKLSIPIMIVNGTTDLQIGIEQANQLKEAYPQSELLIIEGMNHVLKDAPMDMVANSATYNKPELPLSKGLMAGMLAFIKKL